MKLRGYLTSRPFMGERVPQRVQNIVMRDYCEKNGFSYLLGAVEYSFENSTYILDSLVGDHESSDDGLVLYSMFQLPRNKYKRRAIAKKLFNQGRRMDFSLEGFSIGNQDDFNKVEEIWSVKESISESQVDVSLLSQWVDSSWSTVKVD